MSIKFIIIYIFFIITLLYFSYLLTYNYRTETKIKTFETNFIKNIDRRQKNLCSDKYKNQNLADFYVCSSFNPFFTGFLKYDYSSLDMLKKCIIYGSRYIELEIIDNEIKNDTIPVIASSNSDGSILYSQNVLKCSDVFSAISDIAFSEKYLDNYREPFFIYLNLKLKNKNTLNKLCKIIKSTINYRLLGDEYKYQKQNLALTKVCNLLDKIVLFSSDGYENSDMEEIINMSEKSDNLKKIKFNELPHDLELSSKKDVPVISLMSKKIKLTTNLLYILDDTNFLNIGVTPDMIIKINGSSNSENNTNNNTLKIKQVTNNTIVLDPTHNFKDESEENKLSINFFNLDYSLKNIDKQNQSSITIVNTGYDFFNYNYDPELAWNLGCQFVCMNFQKIDYNLKKYMKKFKKYSILLKPSNLRFVEKLPETKNINNLYPKYIEDNNTDIISGFSNKYFEISLIPFKYMKNQGCCVNKEKYTSSNIICSKFTTTPSKCSSKEMCEFTNDLGKCKTDLIKIVYNNDLMSISPNSTLNNSVFEIVNGLDNKFESISIKFGNKYLVSNDDCCYLSFKKQITNSDFNKNASFYAVKPLCNKSNFVSFLQNKNNKKYYVKYRPEFNYNERLYSKTVRDFNFIGELNSEDGQIGIYEAKINNNYKSIGHIFVKGKNHKDIVKSRNTILLKGAISSPIGFKLLWKFNNYHLWKPISADGYLGLGIIMTTNNKKPLKEKFCCVAIEYTEEVNLDNNNYWTNKGNNISNKLSIWETPNKQYYILNLDFKQPSEFAQPVYKFNFEEPNLLDKLFIGTVKPTELESSCFNVINIKKELSNNYERLDFREYQNKNNNKIIVYKNNKKKCIGFDNSYWSDYYNNSVINNNNMKIGIVDCKTNDYLGTNFILNEDGTIRLKDKSNYCLENSENKLILNECKKNDEQTFYYDQNNNNLVSKNNNYCVEISGENIIFNKCNITKISEKNELTEEMGEMEELEEQLSVSVNENSNQSIYIFQDVLTNCIEKNSIIYILKHVRRSPDSFFSKRPDNTILLNVLNEDINRTDFHVYVKGIVLDVLETRYEIKLFDKYSTKLQLPKNTNLIIPSFIPNNTKLIRGTNILLKNGGIQGRYSEEDVRWKATIIKKLENNRFAVVFSINSIEADYNKSSMGRSRTNEQKIVNINDIILLKPTISC